MTICRIVGRGTFRKFEILHISALPSFLCPALLRPWPASRRLSLASSPNLPAIAQPVRRQLLHENHQEMRLVSENSSDHENQFLDVIPLPQQCSGCGALSQTVDSGDPGYFSLSRRTVKDYMKGGDSFKVQKRSSEEQVFSASIQRADSETLKMLNLDQPGPQVKPSTTPLCDRCHNLLHHHTGVSIRHPSIQSIQDTILESPYNYNHVYHVLDAADFPMSLIPNLHRVLNLTPQRSLNRRSKNGRFYHGKKTEVSFIITRSDLLAPQKPQVDSLMPYLVNVLRDALGSVGKDFRLGNVKCVSAKRGWWTKEMKEDIWNRGGGNWLVGKVNVGKSQLFESVFPKGRQNMVESGQRIPQAVPLHIGNDRTTTIDPGVREVEAFTTSGLLPPARTEADFPEMPLVSSLPGTTASPIRVPFGHGRGELVDLPGLSRGDLEFHVQDAHRLSLVMRSRIVPEQQVIKPGQSLLIGGFIRITPTSPDIIILAYSFTPVEPHLTSTQKAINIQNQETPSGVLNIAVEGTAEKIHSAGTFPLKWDVTKQRSGPLTEGSAVGIKVERLPYRVLSTDILIEGCGWVELVAQVRKRSLEKSILCDSKVSGATREELSVDKPVWPEVEVFSPEGKFIAARRPMGAWILGSQRKSSKSLKGRPRPSMKGVKKKIKLLKQVTSL